jgi:selenide, water dikinase
MKDIVLIGAGHAHIEVLRAFGEKPAPGARLTLITRQAWTPYSGMLPGLIAGLYVFEDAHIDVRPLCSFAGARLILDEAVGIELAGEQRNTPSPVNRLSRPPPSPARGEGTLAEPSPLAGEGQGEGYCVSAARRVLCASGASVPFDILSIDIGSTPNTRSIPGACGHAVAIKPIDGFLARFEAARRRILDKQRGARIVVIGGGASGVELALSLEARLRREIAAAGGNAGGLSFKLITAEPGILTPFPRRLRARFQEILASRGIEVMTGRAAARIEDGALHLEGGAALAFDEIFLATEASAAPWLAATGLKLDAQGFIAVRPTLESVSHAGVFAAGDIASFQAGALPKAGVYAVREGPILAANLRRAILGQPLGPYRPQRRHLSLISTGERYALGARNGHVVEGAWVWRWKDWIDRRFMRKYKELPAHPSRR